MDGKPKALKDGAPIQECEQINQERKEELNSHGPKYRKYAFFPNVLREYRVEHHISETNTKVAIAFANLQTQFVTTMAVKRNKMCCYQGLLECYSFSLRDRTNLVANSTVKIAPVKDGPIQKRSEHAGNHDARETADSTLCKRSIACFAVHEAVAKHKSAATTSYDCMTTEGKNAKTK